MDSPMLVSAPISEKPSVVAKASFIIGIIGGGSWILIVILSVVHPAIARSHGSSVIILAIGALALITLSLNLVGFFLGIAAFRKNVPNKWMAIVGAIINGVVLAMIVFVMLVGLVIKIMSPNQSPEPTPIGHRRSAIAGNVTNRARLSFCR
jgi:lysylphosphatidylglycerol synthetase-like protein (DUF2156 family)